MRCRSEGLRLAEAGRPLAIFWPAAELFTASLRSAMNDSETDISGPGAAKIHPQV
jgi:hypothetical protein